MVGLVVLFVALLIVTRVIQPGYGGVDFGSLARAALPYAFATAAQAVVVIAGGIDLSVALDDGADERHRRAAHAGRERGGRDPGRPRRPRDGPVRSVPSTAS